MKRILLVGLLLSALAGCAEPARVDQMTAIPTANLPEASALRHSVQVNNVSGGTSTNPLWLSKVGNPEFQSALQSSLGAAGLLSTGTARYRLDATLVSLNQPFAGFDLSVTSSVHYVLTDTATAKPVFDRGVTADYTATVSDAFIAVERLRLANEGSIKKNIQMFMDQVISELGAKPAISQAKVRPAA